VTESVALRPNVLPFAACTQAEYLAVGEAPTEMRNVLRQRSRWTKGHMQVRPHSL
jgi:cellulose synthase/poly-beta-1,6-N-acetylglucosamine synthase-like glycosyltransferase